MEINPQTTKEAKPWGKQYARLDVDGQHDLIREMWRRKVPCAVIMAVTGLGGNTIRGIAGRVLEP